MCSLKRGGQYARAYSQQTMQDKMALLSHKSLEIIFSAQVTANLSEAKYACNISDDVAEKIAKNVKISLRDYLLYV